MSTFLRKRVDGEAWGAGREMDPLLLGVVVLLLAVGIVMVYSASSALGGRAHADELHYVKGQAIRAVAGFLLMLLIAASDIGWIQRNARRILLFGFALLLLVLIPGVGIAVRGARRWLPLGFTTVQPSEFMKLAVVVYLADFLTRREDRLPSFRLGVLPPLVVFAAAALLTLLQPSLGAVVLLAVVTFGTLLLGGARLHHLALSGVLLLAVGGASVLARPYQLERVIGFLDGNVGVSEEDYQPVQAMIAFGSGGVFGKGFGHSEQKLFFLPDAHTDFIMAIVGEEMGFLGSIAVITLFAILFQRGVSIAWRSGTRFKRLLAAGITLSIFSQTVLNLLVVTRLIPTTGQPLPFLSYGGSSLLFNLMHVGVLLSLSRTAMPHARIEARDDRAVLYEGGIPSEAEFLTP